MKTKFLLFLQGVSGLLIVGGQSAELPYFSPIAACAAFALHWRSLDGLSPRHTERISFVWFFLVQLCLLSWLTAIEYQGIYMLLVYVFLALGMAWQFAFLTRRLRSYSNLSVGSVIQLASCWALLEWMRLYFFSGFAFNFVGVWLASHLLALQAASLCGVLGLSFFVVATNVLGLKALRLRQLRFFLLWGGVALLPYLYGFLQIQWQDRSSANKKEDFYSALLVQTGLSPEQKYSLPNRSRAFIQPDEQWRRVLAELAKQKSIRFDLIVFPEAAFPCGLEHKIYEREKIRRFCQQYLGEEAALCLPQEGSLMSNRSIFEALSRFFKTRIVVGLDYEEGNLNYNSVFCFKEGELLPGRYDKRVLLPLAEYIPFNWAKRISRVYGIEHFFTPGTGPVVFDSFIAPSVCYEELFSDLIREGRKLGAALFVNVTNDGWYPHSSLPRQHLLQGLIRSVENGVPVLRACHAGGTAAIDSLGRIVSLLEINKEKSALGCLAVSLSKKQYRTLYSYYGNIPLVLFCFISFFCHSFFYNIFWKNRAFFDLIYTRFICRKRNQDFL